MSTNYHEQVDTLLKAVPELGGRIHDTYVEGPLAMEPGGVRPLPYVLLASGVANPLDDDSLGGRTDLTALDWRAQTNCVGPTPSHARAVAQVVIRALTDARVGNHWLTRDPDTMRPDVPIKDADVTPPRYFMPLFWRLTTTT
ncbi:hypothetical protein DFO58_2205 [Arthrobacter sp. AG1021]|uniref:hypothetical protein n=1 Tax=Arthrobacter sp. AG1021 TaxID=2183908 RepID=UPI000EAC5319|nr:hypothetical protein [Arthrobacter sp. AG1021]RKS19700.1 hypothetical protein DFO58_2205 [Arthrobacter sp. AG1021]